MFVIQLQVDAKKASDIDLKAIESASNGEVLSITPQRPPAQPQIMGSGRQVTGQFQNTQTSQAPRLPQK